MGKKSAKEKQTKESSGNRTHQTLTSTSRGGGRPVGSDRTRSASTVRSQSAGISDTAEGGVYGRGCITGTGRSLGLVLAARQGFVPIIRIVGSSEVLATSGCQTAA